MPFLSQEQFLEVVKNTPLVSVDLVVRNRLGQVLVGQRENSPAAGFWFTPGGRILKEETVRAAFVRVVKDELGLTLDEREMQLAGLYTHIYTNENFAGVEGVDTHYVVIRCDLDADLDLEDLPRAQHQAYHWMEVTELLEEPLVHDYVKAYFQEGKADALVRRSETDSKEIEHLIELYSTYQEAIGSYNASIWQFPAALFALNLLAVQVVPIYMPVLLVMFVVNLVFLQSMAKLATNQREIILVLKNLERELWERFPRPPKKRVIPAFRYKGWMKWKSASIVWWMLLVANLLLLVWFLVDLIPWIDRFIFSLDG
jgi:colanic acid biosynthesis protein WcaH